MTTTTTIPAHVQIALGELGEAQMKDGEACHAAIERAATILRNAYLEPGATISFRAGSTVEISEDPIDPFRATFIDDDVADVTVSLVYIQNEIAFGFCAMSGITVRAHLVDVVAA